MPFSERAPGFEWDSTLFLEAELLLYGGAGQPRLACTRSQRRLACTRSQRRPTTGRYLAARARLARWFERDAAARTVQTRALRAICRPNASRPVPGSFGRGVVAGIIQRWWRRVLAAHPDRYPPRPKPRRRDRSSAPKKATYEEIIRRLRMTMYVRKLQALFRSPRYQRQAYLRRRACLTMQVPDYR